MPDSQRLQSLRHQRALLLQQLSELEQQIARESAAPVAPASSSTTPANPVAPAIAVPRPVSPAAEAEADALLAQLVASEGSSKPFSKSGCWLIFTGVMLAALALVGVVYFFFYR